jgi:hypothetical protein
MVHQTNKNSRPFAGGVSPSYGIFGNPALALSNNFADLNNKSAGKK